MPTKPRYVTLDPNEVRVHPNVRHDLGDLRGLTRSVKELGVLVPAVVVPDDDGYVLVIGQRRQAAAIEADKQLPALVGEDVDDARRLAEQLAENLHRKALTAGEEAAAYEQLGLLGMSTTAIAKITGMSRTHVRTARAVAASDTAMAAAERFDLSLEQAAVLAEFDTDREAVKALTVVAKSDPSRFGHTTSRLRQDRQRAEQLAATVEALSEAGVTVIEDTTDHPKAVSLRDLTDSDASPISPEDHGECPGRAAVVTEWDPSQVRHYCLDPSAHGHRDRHSRNASPVAAPLSDAAKEERREVVENNKAWRASEPVRRDYLASLLARRIVPKGTLRFVTEEILADPESVGSGKDELLAALVAIDAPDGWGRHVGAALAAKAPDARLPLVLLAQVAADREQRMGVHTWRRRDTAAARWLAFLSSTGYALSDIEQSVVDQVAEEDGDGSADEGDDDPGDEAA